MSQTLQACDRCAGIKQLCTGVPCRRCARLKLTCQIVRARRSNAVQQEMYQPNNAVTALPKGVIRRVRTGCVSCKKRRKKCDEQLPKCGDCQRLNLICEVIKPTSDRKQSAANAAALSPISSILASIEDSLGFSEVPSDTVDFGHSVSSRGTSDVEPVYTEHDSFSVDTTGNFSSTIVRDSTASSPSKLSGYSDVENGSFFGAMDDDFTLLSGSTATTNSFPDTTSHLNPDSGDIHQLSPATSSELSMSYIDSAGNSTSDNDALLLLATASHSLVSNSLRKSIPFLENPEDEMLFYHYKTVVSRALSIVQEDELNPFLRIMIPLALENESVMEAILALSASHMRATYPEVEKRGLTHQNRALTTLAKLLNSKISASADSTLASVLLLCIVEITEGTSTKWTWHISAAKTIVTSRFLNTNSTMSPTDRFLLDIFGYVDSIATITQCKPPLLKPETYSQEEQPVDLPQIFSDDLTYDKYNEAVSAINAFKNKERRVYHPLFGLAEPLFKVIGDISSLANQRKDRVDEVSEIWFRDKARRMDEKLREWEPHRQDHATRSSSKTHTQADMVYAAISVKWASLMRLHQIVEGYEMNHPAIVECVDNIMAALEMIRYGSPVESSLLFPLIMVSVGARNIQHRMIARGRWMVMERTIGFGNIFRGRELIEKVWGKMDVREETMKQSVESGDGQPAPLPVNWAEIRYLEFPGVVLF